MTKAMPFLQKVILLSYDPRPLSGGPQPFLRLLHGFEHLPYALGEEACPGDGLLERISMSPHLYQKGTWGEVLVVAAGAEGDGPG